MDNVKAVVVSDEEVALFWEHILANHTHTALNQTLWDTREIAQIMEK